MNVALSATLPKISNTSSLTVLQRHEWKQFLPLLNKVVPFKVTKMVDLLLLRIFPVKVNHKSYLLAIYLIKLILYQIWLARCSHRMQQKLIHPLTIIKGTEAAIKQQITLCFQTQTTASAKQMQIWRAKDALCTLDPQSELTSCHLVCLHLMSLNVHIYQTFVTT